MKRRCLLFKKQGKKRFPFFRDVSSLSVCCGVLFYLKKFNCDRAYMHKGASLVAQQQRICLQCRRCRRHGFDPWVGKIPWRRAWQSMPVL